MGGDGGSIPKRDDLVRTRTKPEQAGKCAGMLTRWKHCAITQEPLRPPIVACELGRLFNKESLIEFLLDRSKFECAPKLGYIRGLKDVKELHLSENPAFITEGCKAGCADLVSPFICPITGLEMSGRYRFCYLLGCGCVFSERALKEIKDLVCTKCGKTYTEGDIVMINGTDEEMADLQIRMDERRLAAKSSKVPKKRKAQSEAAEVQSEPSDQAAGCSESKTCRLTAGSHPHSDVSSKVCHSKVGGSELSRSSSASASGKLTSGSTTTSGKDKKHKTIQDDPKASSVYKSLFNTSEKALNQQKSPWVTFNPQYF